MASRPSSLIFFLVFRWTYTGVGKKLAKMFDVFSGAFGAMVRVMHEIRNTVQRHLETRTVRGLHVGSKVIEQRLHLAPVNIGNVRLLKNCAQQIGLFVTHSGLNPLFELHCRID